MKNQRILLNLVFTLW